MVRVTITFPLGVYHAQSSVSFQEAEWPPSPVRLVGALLAAAHGRIGHDPEPERALLQRLCEATPPVVIAPPSVAVGDPVPAHQDPVVRLRGASRWAPRNHTASELKELSTRNVGRGRAAVEKVGTAIGCRPVHIVWTDVELAASELERLAALAADVTFLGTARSPVLIDVTDEPAPGDGDDVWTPLPDDAHRRRGQVEVRVPEPSLIRAFDQREAARRASKDRVERAGLIPSIRLGREVTYARGVVAPFDPRRWGDMLVLVVDREDSETIVKAPASYLLARAFRASLLGAFGAVGEPDEAPEILRARGDEPHCAIVPLPFVNHPRADGHVMGVGVVLPHGDQVADLDAQRMRVEQGLLRFSGIGGNRRYVDIPGAGRMYLRPSAHVEADGPTLRPDTYDLASRCWTSVTPVVHSRWRTASGRAALLKQVTADCADVGLPAPALVEVRREPWLAGAPARLMSTAAVPEAWRSLLKGPVDHVRVTFDEEVVGPVLLGRARHFGLGLCRPVPDEATA